MFIWWCGLPKKSAGVRGVREGGLIGQSYISSHMKYENIVYSIVFQHHEFIKEGG